jgi:transcription antitermination factor NusG
MTFSTDQLFQANDAHWFCLKAQPKHEHIAAAALRRTMGLETLAPRIRFRKATQRGAVWFVEAMFPGYLFTRCVYRDTFRGVQSAPGVRGFVRFGDGVAGIGDGVIAELQKLLVAEETVTFEPELEVGARVKITEGAFHGLEAVITQLLPAKERVKVLLTFLGREVEAEVTGPRLLPAQSPRSASLGIATQG